jgi:predicted glycosyltransferase
VSFGQHFKNLGGKIYGIFKFDYRLYKEAKIFKPDLFLSMASIYAAHAAFALRKPHIAFEDSEPVFEHQILYVPFTDHILTPIGLKKNFGAKQIRYPGFNEISYLHPNYFNPDQSILKMLNVNENEKYTLVRFVSFKASHDIGVKGFSNKDKITLINRLKKYGKVFITSEGNLSDNLKKYSVKIPPSKLQDALYYAFLYIGDSQTMATEAALLGTPAIRCNSFAKTKREMSNFIELEEKYKLVVNFNIKNKNAAMDKAVSFFNNEKLKEEWIERKDILFSNKIDVTKFLIWFVENYPNSVKIINNTPEYFTENSFSKGGR